MPDRPSHIRNQALKHVLATISIVVVGASGMILNGQVVFTDDFGTGCSTGNFATTYGWTVSSTGTNQGTANIWYVSAAERGVGAGNCGAGCGGTNSRSLHISAHPAAGGDLGAAYYESSAFGCGFLGLCSVTNKRVESPTIDCSGISSIPITFEYIEFGEGSNDNAQLWYHDGSTWSLLSDLPKSSCCGGGCTGFNQGLWTTYSGTLPVSADNNPNVRIAFNWTNNGNGSGTDPSFAADNIQVGAPVLPVELTNFTQECMANMRLLRWTTATETNSDYFIVQSSPDGVNWKEIGKVEGAGNSNSETRYTFSDFADLDHIRYYRLRQTDFDGAYSYSDIIAASPCTDGLLVHPNPSADGNYDLTFGEIDELEITVYTAIGALVPFTMDFTGTNTARLNIDHPDGVYYLIIQNGNRTYSEILLR